MRGLVFFPGRYSLTDLGATAVVTRNIFTGVQSELSGAIMGMGTFARGLCVPDDFLQINLLADYRHRSAWYRIGLRLQKSCPLQGRLLDQTQSWMDNKLGIIADRLAADQLEKLVRNNAAIEVALGYAGESLLYGQAAKANGMRYAVHSQFCHPYVQNKLISDAYKSNGLKPPHVSQLRLRRQLATLELADVIWCPSDFARRSLIENGVPDSKLFISHLGVDLNKFTVPARPSYVGTEFQILFVGSVSLQKGIHILLEALVEAEITNVSMVFNGNCTDAARKIIRKYSNRLVAKKIAIKIDSGDPRRYHKTASVFVLPSVHDSYGIVVVEAMAAGLPVIVSDHAGAHEIVEHGENGWIFQSGSVYQLAKYLKIACKNPKLLSRFSRKSEMLSKRYDCRESILRTKIGLGLI